jgi:hypothetical protein
VVARFRNDGENGFRPDTRTRPTENKLQKDRLCSVHKHRRAAEVLLNGVFMSKFNSPLENLSIASPCSANWDEMFGNERKRFCGDCKLNVYNLSGMTRDEAERVLIGSEGRVCVRYFKRWDGTVLTKDCPVGWARLKKRLSTAATAVFSLVVSLFSGIFFVSLFSKQTEMGRRFPLPYVEPTPMPLMGAVAIPSPTPTPHKPKVEPKDSVMGRVAQRPV